MARGVLFFFFTPEALEPKQIIFIPSFTPVPTLGLGQQLHEGVQEEEEGGEGGRPQGVKFKLFVGPTTNLKQ